MWNRMHQVEIRHRQQLATASGEPGFLSAGLTQRTVPIPAGVIDVPRRAARVAAFDMAAERSGALKDSDPLRAVKPARAESYAAGDDSAPDARTGDRQVMRREIGRSKATQDVGQAHAVGCRIHVGRSARWQAEQF